MSCWHFACFWSGQKENGKRIPCLPLERLLHTERARNNDRPCNGCKVGDECPKPTSHISSQSLLQQMMADDSLMADCWQIVAADGSLVSDDPSEPNEVQTHWFFHELQTPAEEKKAKLEPLVVRSISGATIVALSPRTGENAAALKRRIQEKEGTAVFVQKLVQDGQILCDADVVKKKELYLVRVPRKKMIIASLHADLRAYDLETGIAMRVVPSVQLRLSCMIVDWENGRCFTGSSDGTVRVWDVHSCECLGKLAGVGGKIAALASNDPASNEQPLVIAAATTGILKCWSLRETGSGAVEGESFNEWETDVRGDVAASIDFKRMWAVVSGETEQSQPLVAAYDLKNGDRLWAWRLPLCSQMIFCDWDTRQCLMAPGNSFLELRSLRALAAEEFKPKRFAYERLYLKGRLVNVDWASNRVVFVASPFALELWSLLDCKMLFSICDPSGDGLDIISLDVDWSQDTPRAITCRTYMDWELVAGEVCMQQWDLQENGDVKNTVADHPLIGGFDVVAAVAQF